jgi:hypothetical protein
VVLLYMVLSLYRGLLPPGTRKVWSSYIRFSLYIEDYCLRVPFSKRVPKSLVLYIRKLSLYMDYTFGYPFPFFAKINLCPTHFAKKLVRASALAPQAWNIVRFPARHFICWLWKRRKKPPL